MKLNDSISGRTKLLGLIGNPVLHSVSPLIHNTLSTMLGIDAVYITMKAERDALGDAVKGLRACNFSGFNITIPFKEEILKYVDNMTDEVRNSGSANTVKNVDGCLMAFNTDAGGFERAFKDETGNSFEGKKIVILGAGGTARSLAAIISSKGAEKLTIFNRTVEKADTISKMLRKNYDVVCAAADLADRALLRDIITDADIIINTTSAGLYPNIGDSPLGEGVPLNSKQIVYDVIYNPVKTKLLRQAEDSGCKAVNGLGMLYYQGVLAYEIWMDLKIPEDISKGLYSVFSNYLNK